MGVRHHPAADPQHQGDPRLLGRRRVGAGDRAPRARRRRPARSPTSSGRHDRAPPGLARPPRRARHPAARRRGPGRRPTCPPSAAGRWSSPPGSCRSSTAACAAPARSAARSTSRPPRPTRRSARSTPWPRSTTSSGLDSVARIVQGRRLRGQRRGLHRPAAGGQRRQRAARQDLRRGRAARPQRRRRRRAAAGRARSRSSSPSNCSDAPAEPRQAATVLLLRDGAPGLEVYLLRRTKGMPFAGGMTAYPGGGVDPRDGDTEIAWAGPSPAQWAARVRLRRADRARAGLRRRPGDVRGGRRPAGRLRTTAPVVPDVSGDDWEEQRQALLTRELSLAELLAGRGLALRSDLLRPFAHWITPPVGAAALRHQVLRRGAAGRPGGAARLRRGRRGRRG